MKGTIEFKMDGISNIVCKVKTTPLHKFEKLILMDAMMQALALDEEEKQVIGLTIACGGMNTFGLGGETIGFDMAKINEALKHKGSDKQDLTSEEK